MMNENIKEILKRLLKSNLINIREIALFQERKETDKEELLNIVERIYKNRIVNPDDSESVLINEDELFALIEYIENESTYINLPGTDLKPFIPTYPYSPTYPYCPNCPNYPQKQWWQPDIVYASGDQNSISTNTYNSKNNTSYTIR